MGLLTLWARQMEYNEILLAKAHLASPDIRWFAEALPHWTGHFCSKCFLMDFCWGFVCLFSLLRVCCFFLKTKMSVSCWAKCLLTTATQLWEEWRLTSQWGFGVLLVRRIPWYFSLALAFISNMKLQQTDPKTFYSLLRKRQKSNTETL